MALYAEAFEPNISDCGGEITAQSQYNRAKVGPATGWSE